MIRALIVEDETTIRSGLVRHLSWAELGVDEVRAAESAEEAFPFWRIIGLTWF